jgi:class 3 adenylate cyclase
MAKDEIRRQLERWIDELRATGWAAFVVDADWRLIWVSESFKGFLGESDDDVAGVGKHIAECLTSETWRKRITEESQVRVLLEVGPYLVDEMESSGMDFRDLIDVEPLRSLVDQIEPKKLPYLFTTYVDYIEPRGGEDLAPFRVDLSVTTINDDGGRRLGVWVTTNMHVRPNLQALLARGDEAMYERMAKLVDPGSRQAAILFCDMSGSGALSRRLPSAAYFRLVRRLWTGIDSGVAANQGIVGKHAGDGASAFFLVDDLGSSSAAAAAAIRTARSIHEQSGEIFGEVLESGCMMRVGLHWGGSLYMGQLIPGGRLDVTALGDEVNECARIQECAGNDETLASKQLVEQLDPDSAAGLGMDLEKIKYELLNNLPNVPEKAVRDAGALSVTRL